VIPRHGDSRFLAWAWVGLAVAFMATSGKPYTWLAFSLSGRIEVQALT